MYIYLTKYIKKNFYQTFQKISFVFGEVLDLILVFRYNTLEKKIIEYETLIFESILSRIFMIENIFDQLC